MDEETIIDQKEAQKQSANKEVKKNDKDAPKSKRKITTSARIATAAFVGGVASSRLFTPMKVFPQASLEGINDSDTQTNAFELAPEASSHLVGHDISIASEVNDSLSFNEAFAAARKETGPGGLFVWHGHTYGTYYKNEWDAMSQEEQDQYWANVHHTSNQIRYEEPEFESESVSELDAEQGSELGNEQELQENDAVNAEEESIETEEQELQEDNVDVADAEEDDAELIEVELDDEADGISESVEDVVEGVAFVETENESDAEVVLDENETNVAVEMGDEEPIEVIIEDEAEVMMDDVDENDEIELAAETEDESLEEPLQVDVDMDEIEDVVLDENEMVEIGAEMDMPEDIMDDQSEDCIMENADIDDSATTSFDPEIPIDNNMDMSEFS